MQPNHTNLNPAESLLVLLISKETFTDHYICLVEKESEHTTLNIVRLKDEELLHNHVTQSSINKKVAQLKLNQI